MPQAQVAKILKKEMSRKEFIKYTSGVVLASIGITGLIGNMVRLTDPSRGTGADSGPRAGYGTGAYGR